MVLQILADAGQLVPERDAVAVEFGARADAGQPYAACSNPALVAEAMDPNWNGPIILPEGQWALPAGAFGSGGGPG